MTGVHSYRKVSVGLVAALGRRSEPITLDSASTSCLPAKRLARTTTRSRRRSGFWSSRASPTLRHPGGEEQLEPWDIVFFPAGPSGAHLVRNNSESTARVAMFSSKSGAIGVVVYPDSDMVWMWTADDAVDMIVERSSALDDAAPWAAGRVGRTDVR